MAYMMATVASDAEHLPGLLETLRGEVLVPPPDLRGETWAIGYYADDRALIICKPLSLLSERSMARLAGTIRSRILMACIQTGPDSRARPPPYRHRRWLFAHTGDLGALAAHTSRIRERLPAYVREEIAEEGPGLLAFGMFLAELHRAGLDDSPLVGAADLTSAMRRTAEAVHGLGREAGEVIRAGLVATNGRSVVAVRMGAPLWWKAQHGLEVSPDVAIDAETTDARRMSESLRRFRAIVLAHDDARERPGWTEIAEGGIFHVDGRLEPQISY